MKKILFRIEASNSSGMGHLVESISIANCLRKKCDCEITFLVNFSKLAVDLIKSNGFEVLTLNNALSEEQESATTVEIIKKQRPRIVICDLSNGSDLYFEAIKEHTEFLAVILDNNVHKRVPGDLVINFSIAQNASFYENNNITNTYVGPMHMPLDAAIQLQTPTRNKTVKKIFLNQGGSDPYELTNKIIGALELLDLEQEIIVVMGGAMMAEHIEKINMRRPSLKNNYTFYYDINHRKIIELMASADLAITAPGNTLYELAALGIPSITVCHHETHNSIARKFAEKNAVINLGIGIDMPLATIAEATTKLINDAQQRNNLRNCIRRVTDGKGCERIAGLILTKCGVNIN